jgi:hypothetical protein
MLSMTGCVGWKVKGFGGDEKEVVDEERDVDEDEDEEEADGEGVVEDAVESDSESESELLPSEASESLVVFCVEEGNTVGTRTGRLGMSNVVLGDLLRFLRCVISDSHTTIGEWSRQIKSQKVQKEKNWPSCFVSISTSKSIRDKDDNLTQIRSPSLTALNGLSFKSSKSSNSRIRSLPLNLRAFKA